MTLFSKSLFCKRLLLISLLFVGGTICAQNGVGKVVVKGRIVEADGIPAAYASAILIKDGQVVTGAMSDSLGNFQIKGKMEGNYRLKISSVGFADSFLDVKCLLGKTLDVGVITLKENAIQLQGVTVSASAATKSVTLEKTRIDAPQSVSASTGSVLELIRSSASVNVSGNDEVSIRGNSNVLILVDGVPTTLGGLGAIPAANVQSIEVITSPDVKYDSEGTGGIISIVSKKQSVNTCNALAGFNYGFSNFMNGNLAVNYNKGKWGYRFNFNGRYERDEVESTLYRVMNATGNSLDERISAIKKTGNMNVGLNFNYKARKADVLTLDVKAIFPRLNNVQDFDNLYVNGGIQQVLHRQTDITFNREMVEGSLGWKHSYVPMKRELSMTYTISKIRGHRPSYYYEEGTMVQKSKSGGHPFNTSLQADYMTEAFGGKFETGAKMTYRQNNIDHKMFELDESSGEWGYSLELSNDLRHREYIPALYAMFSSGLGGGFSFKAGLRGEYSYVTLDSQLSNVDTHSDCWFVAPNVVFGYKASERWSLSFGVSRRISRPTYPQLNPYINLIDNQTYETGNVHLSPEKANKVDFGYSFSGGADSGKGSGGSVSGKGSGMVSVVGNAYLNYTTDYINQIATLRDNVLVMTYINGTMDLKAGVEHNLSWNVFGWLTASADVNVWYSKSKAECDGADVANSGWVGNGNVSLDFKPAKGLLVQTQYFATTRQYFPQFTAKAVNYCSIGVKRSFMKNALSVSATLTDVFNSRRWNISSQNSVYNLLNNSKNISRMLWLGVSYNFNSFKPVKGGQKKVSEDDRSLLRLGD